MAAPGRKKVAIKLSTEAHQVFGLYADDMAPMIEAIAPFVANVIRENAETFEPHEWRAMAFVIRQLNGISDEMSRVKLDGPTLMTSLPHINELTHFASAYGIDYNGLVYKLDKLAAHQLNILIATLEYGIRKHQRHPQNLNTDTWWMIGIEVDDSHSQGEQKKNRKKAASQAESTVTENHHDYANVASE